MNTDFERRNVTQPRHCVIERSAIRDDAAGGDDAFAMRANRALGHPAMKPDVEWDECEGMPYGGVYHGREPIVANVFGPILADVEGFAASPDEILALDDNRVIARGRHGGTGAAGPVDARFVHIWTITDGQVSRYEQLADTRKFCDAVGK